MSAGSFKTNKLSTRSKMNKSIYNKNAASKFGNTKMFSKPVQGNNTKSK